MSRIIVIEFHTADRCQFVTSAQSQSQAAAEVKKHRDRFPAATRVDFHDWREVGDRWVKDEVYSEELR